MLPSQFKNADTFAQDLLQLTSKHNPQSKRYIFVIMTQRTADSRHTPLMSVRAVNTGATSGPVRYYARYTYFQK